MNGLNGFLDESGNTRFHAPILRSKTRFTLLLHGRIDNVTALCAGLPDAHAAQDEADSLLCLWRQRGAACLPDLDGAFALAIWDAQERELTLARDRFGQKPLYYRQDKEALTFASDAALIAPDPASADCNALFHYLTVQSVPAPLCAFQGVNKVPHAHSLVWRCGKKAQLQRYWTPVFSPSFSGTLDDAAAVLDELLRTALSRHAQAPGLATLLSGGVDSSLMVALVHASGRTPATFSMGFAEHGFDERPFAREVAQLFGATQHELNCSDLTDLPVLVDTLVAHFGEPFADSSALPTWLALHAVREAGYDTVILGDGGDDLFAGYERHLNPFLYSGADTTDKRAAQLRTELDGLVAYAPLASGINAGNAMFYTHWARFWGSLKRDLCGEALREAANPPASLILARQLFQPEMAHNLLDAMQQFELDYYLPCTLTPKVEVPARAGGLSTVAPFVCNAVADFALSLPPSFRVGACEGAGSFGSGFETKRVVKRLAERYLPKSIVYRRKMGFGVPLAQWLRGPLRELTLETLRGQRCAQRGWLVPKTVHRLLDEHMQGLRDWHYPLWTLLMQELWAQKFLDAPRNKELS